MDKLNWIKTAMLMALILVTSGCGRNEQSPSVATDVQGTGQQSVVTPTVREDFVWETEVAIAVATEQVQTAPPLPPATFPPAPTLVPEAVTTDCQPLDDFIPRNCWRSEQRGIAIQAGFRNSNPRQGAVQFFARGMEIHDTPTQVGLVKLRTVNYPYATVFTGTIEFTFNLETRQWVTANGSPTATVEPEQVEKTTMALNDIKEEQTAFAAPDIPEITPTDGPPWVGPPPTPNIAGRTTPVAGDGYLIDDTSLPLSAYRIRNAWVYWDDNGNWLTVYAGYEQATMSNPPVQGIIVVQEVGWTGYGPEMRGQISYRTPQRVGYARVIDGRVDSAETTVDVRTEDGSIFTFNVTTSKWTSANGIPIASTPTATPIGQ